MKINDLLLEADKWHKWRDAYGNVSDLSVKDEVTLPNTNVSFVWDGRQWIRKGDGTKVPVNSKYHKIIMGNRGFERDGRTPLKPALHKRLINYLDKATGSLGMASRNDPNLNILGKLGGVAGDAVGKVAQAGVDAIYRGGKNAAAAVGNAKQKRAAYKAAQAKANQPTSESVMVTEGGSMPGVGAIHISEIEPTLKKLEQSLGVPLMNNALGSVGKRQFSGDIDVAINLPQKKMDEFVKRLEASPMILDIARSSVIMTKVRIVGYDANLETDRNRTGFVQVDFMPGDPEWLKTYYHSPREEESKYKGVYRNVMLATIAAMLDRKDSKKETDDGRPLRSERLLWSPTQGLVRVLRTPVKNKNGGYLKKNQNEVIDGPWTNTKDIVRQLKLNSVADLNSYESLRAAIEQNYPQQLVQEILSSIRDNKQIQSLGMPDDL